MPSGYSDINRENALRYGAKPENIDETTGKGKVPADQEAKKYGDSSVDITGGLANFQGSNISSEYEDLSKALGIDQDKFFAAPTLEDRAYNRMRLSDDTLAALKSQDIDRVGSTRVSADKGVIFGGNEAGDYKIMDEYELKPNMLIDRILPVVATTLFTAGMGSGVGAVAGAAAGGGTAGTIASLAAKGLTGALISAGSNDGKINTGSVLASFIPTGGLEGAAKVAAGIGKSVIGSKLGSTVDLDGTSDRDPLVALKALYGADQQGKLSGLAPAAEAAYGGIQNQVGAATGEAPSQPLAPGDKTSGAAGRTGVQTAPPQTSLSNSRQPPPIANLLLLLLRNKMMNGGAGGMMPGVGMAGPQIAQPAPVPGKV